MGLLLLQSSCRMVLFQLSVLLMLASTHSHPHKRQADDMDHGDMNMAGEEECCDQKMVGEDRYFNIGYDHNGMTFDLNCLSPCIFEKEDQPGSKYCFAAGDMKVECEDDMDYTPTNRPRPTGEMTEGPDGETDGMTDDGMTEDPNGVTGGSTCKCGLEGERRIVGGEDSTSGKYPWIVSLNAGPAFGSDSHMHNCGGTLVASNWVVTAAHCIVDAGTPKKDDLTVLLGAFDFANDDDTRRKNVALEIDPTVKRHRAAEARRVRRSQHVHPRLHGRQGCGLHREERTRVRLGFSCLLSRTGSHRPTGGRGEHHLGRGLLIPGKRLSDSVQPDQPDRVHNRLVSLRRPDL